MRLPLAVSSPRSATAHRSVASLVARFALSGLSVVVVVALIGGVALRHLSVIDAEHDAAHLTRALAMGIVQPAVDDRLVAGDRAAVRRLDRMVRARILHDPVRRVKIWSSDGRVVYSDEPRLIGGRFGLAGEERAALTDGRPHAELSDLSRPEHRYERRDHRLLEVYVRIRTPSGVALLYEDYVRFESVTAQARQTLAELAPALVAVLIGVWLAQLPLVMALVRQMRDSQHERENLLLRLIRASDVERGRIAAGLHDGPVQDLSGISFSLGAAARDVDRLDRESLRTVLSRAAGVTRESMRQLRSLLVTLHPPVLESSGLAPVLDDLAAPLRARGIEVAVDIADDVELSAPQLKLCFRAAQEALRNVAEHADAAHVAVDLTRADGRVTLTVRDDGRGFSPGDAHDRRRHGHVGLSLLHEGAADIGGRLMVESSAGRGTTVRLDMPTT
jgi:two-component system, NarL family, sensor kinase